MKSREFKEKVDDEALRTFQGIRCEGPVKKTKIITSVFSVWRLIYLLLNCVAASYAYSNGWWLWGAFHAAGALVETALLISSRKDKT